MANGFDVNYRDKIIIDCRPVFFFNFNGEFLYVDRELEIGQDAIYAANKIKKLAIVYCIMAISNIVGAFIFAKSYGAIGICLCICIAYFVRTVGMDIILKRNIIYFMSMILQFTTRTQPLLFQYYYV